MQNIRYLGWMPLRSRFGSCRKSLALRRKYSSIECTICIPSYKSSSTFRIRRACLFPSQLICYYVSYFQFVGLLRRGISLVARPLPTQATRRKPATSVCSHLLTLVPCLRIFLPWKWRWYVLPKRQLTQDLHGATSQKTAFFRSTIVFNLPHSGSEEIYGN
jgi:hypothetical protein